VTSRFEVLPFGRAEEEAARLPEPVRLTVTASPSHGIDDTVETGTRLRALGHDVTVHLAARMVRDSEHLDALLATMAEAGIDDAFVIGGDTTPPVGTFASAGDLLPLVDGHAHRPARIGIAGYPEGHPLIADATLAEVLEEKSRLADYVTTQLCFDPDVLLGWVRGVRASGVAVPVIVGAPGKVDRLRLLEIATKVGVGPSLAFLKKQRGLRSLLRLSASSADRLYDALAPHVCDPELGVEGFHWFTFNRLVETWTWEREKSA
jgi:methylenetetrahydrofolate reductase (NADPH)